METRKYFRKTNFKYSDINPSYVDDTDYLSKNSHFDDEMVPFDKTTVQNLQKLHFHRNVLEVCLRLYYNILC